METDPRQAFIDTISILATKLSRSEYTRVTSTMYQLHCGANCGFDVGDVMMLPTFEEIWKLNKEQRLKAKAKVKVFTVYDNKNKS